MMRAMKSDALEQFLSVMKRDAAVQERVADAMKHAAPLEAISAIASEAGCPVTIEDLRTVFNGQLADRDLEAVAGGTFSPAEWFAEGFRALQPRGKD